MNYFEEYIYSIVIKHVIHIFSTMFIGIKHKESKQFGVLHTFRLIECSKFQINGEKDRQRTRSLSKSLTLLVVHNLLQVQ